MNMVVDDGRRAYVASVAGKNKASRRQVLPRRRAGGHNTVPSRADGDGVGAFTGRRAALSLP